MSPFLTSKENIVVNLIYASLPQESHFNRTYDRIRRSRRAFRSSRHATPTSTNDCERWQRQDLLLTKSAILKPGTGTLGMRIFRPRYRWKPCALRYSRWLCHRSAAAPKCLIFLGL